MTQIIISEDLTEATIRTEINKQTYENKISPVPYILIKSLNYGPLIKELAIDRNNPEFTISYSYRDSLTTVGNFNNPPVTLPHLYLCKTIIGNDLHKGEDIVDLGCDAGFIGNFMANNVDYDELDFIDLNPDALKASLNAFCYLNDRNSNTEFTINMDISPTYGNLKEGNKNINFIKGDARRILKNKDKFLSASAPLYIPGAIEVFPEIYKIFGHASKGNLIVAYSSTAENNVSESAREIGKKIEIIDSMEVPYEFPISKSIKNRDIFGVIKRDGIPYHKIIVSRMANK